MGGPFGLSVHLTGQGRVAAPSGWCGPQRSEDTGQAGRILDAVRVVRSLPGQGDVILAPCPW